MLNFLDVYERAVKGPIMSERDFDMKLFVPTLNRVVRTYGIKYDKENPVPSDDKAADVLALSSLMMKTLPGQRELIDTLKEMKLREKYFVIVGGGPVTQEWADKIGADGYGRSAVQAVEMIRKLMGKKKR